MTNALPKRTILSDDVISRRQIERGKIERGKMVYECDQCRASLPPRAVFCPECGVAFDERVPADAIRPDAPEAATGRGDNTESRVNRKYFLEIDAAEIHLLLWLCSKTAKPGTKSFRVLASIEERLLIMQADLRGEPRARRAVERPLEILERPLWEPLVHQAPLSPESNFPPDAARPPIAGRIKKFFSRGT